ncbi:hypothetical protein Pyrde_0924 [Pyrodictium delaneyi]|uniref:Uncharacterized protein n=1 Tax=Pyrodictium delaneyi TaxID=1273541 RepID=A0A0P0N2P6_9CREN|nr:helix-turn-helix domain-containing protein [Pyrodictium delaneyi]ALL00972.1 hypothetical protein Pyrde_0924 [Pyrodictium delaneyi]
MNEKDTHKVDIEERLERLEILLEKVLERISRLERILALNNDETARIASQLVVALALPAIEALEAARRVVAVTSSLEDPVSRSIVEVLADCEPLSISEITRRLRKLRGHASRTTVRKRLQILEKRGIVANIGTTARPLYTLTICIREDGEQNYE